MSWIDDGEDPPARNAWVEYTTDQLDKLLIGLEIHFEDQVWSFLSWAIGGALLIAVGIFQIYSAVASGNSTPDWWPWLYVLFGLFAVVAGIALWINNGRELRLIRRMRKLVEAGKLP